MQSYAGEAAAARSAASGLQRELAVLRRAFELEKTKTEAQVGTRKTSHCMGGHKHLIVCKIRTAKYQPKASLAAVPCRSWPRTRRTCRRSAGRPQRLERRATRSPPRCRWVSG